MLQRTTPNDATQLSQYEIAVVMCALGRDRQQLFCRLFALPQAASVLAQPLQDVLQLSRLPVCEDLTACIDALTVGHASVGAKQAVFFCYLQDGIRNAFGDDHAPARWPNPYMKQYAVTDACAALAFVQGVRALISRLDRLPKARRTSERVMLHASTGSAAQPPTDAPVMSTSHVPSTHRSGQHTFISPSTLAALRVVQRRLDATAQPLAHHGALLAEARRLCANADADFAIWAEQQEHAMASMTAKLVSKRAAVATMDEDIARKRRAVEDGSAICAQERSALAELQDLLDD